MKALNSLPQDYLPVGSVDLQKNKKQALLVNLLAVAIALIMVVPMCFVVPFSTAFRFDSGIQTMLIRLGVLLGLIVAYMVLHELVHGIAMKLCGTKKVKYGFTGLYAFAGSEDYYDKKSYIFIALAPVVLWGAVLAVLNVLVPVEWFWIVYLIQVNNISGAAGDLYVTVKFSRMPKDILVKDHGTGMAVFAKEEK